LTSRNKTDRAAQAAAFEFIGHAIHNLPTSKQGDRDPIGTLARPGISSHEAGRGSQEEGRGDLFNK
jgi:hypothetical protein